MRHCDLWAAGALALGLAFSVGAARAESDGVKIGTLTCQVDGGWGYVLGSSKRVTCEYDGIGGMIDRYVGTLSRFGVDVGYTDGATMVWAVLAPTVDVGPGALQGDYAGATASATVIGGVGANALVGGLDRSVALQPLSLEGNTGYVDVAAGIGELHLREALPPPLAYAASPPPAAVKHFEIFFEFNRDRLNAEARAIVRDAVASAGTGGLVRVKVTGHTDTVGSESYNLRLSVRRAEAVKAEMVRDGLNPAQIAIDGRGFHDPLVATGPGVREPQNRRAVIELGNTVVRESGPSLTRQSGSL